MGTHKGQVSFPGGHREGNEDASAAAVREAVEELGVPAASISVLGFYHDVIASACGGCVYAAAFYTQAR